MTKPAANRVIGIDASTSSLAFAIFEAGKPIRCGEVVFSGADVFERLHDAKTKVSALVKRGILVADFIAIESAVMVNNPQVGIKLAYVYGAILGELMKNNPQVHVIPPITWQTSIGNPNLKTSEKSALRVEFPGHKESWYKTKSRQIRKDRTMAIARKYFKIANDSNDVSDSVGLALYASNALTRPGQ